jgi:hypothetical protein
MTTSNNQTTEIRINDSTKAKVRHHGKYNEKITVSIHKAGYFAPIASKTFVGCDRENLATNYMIPF